MLKLLYYVHFFFCAPERSEGAQKTRHPDCVAFARACEGVRFCSRQNAASGVLPAANRHGVMDCERGQTRHPDGSRPFWVGVAERDMGVFLICTARACEE